MPSYIRLTCVHLEEAVSLGHFPASREIPHGSDSTRVNAEYSGIILALNTTTPTPEAATCFWNSFSLSGPSSKSPRKPSCRNVYWEL